MKIPDAKAAVEKLEKLPAWQLEKVKSKKEVILEAQSPLCFIGGHMPPQKCGVRSKATEVQRQNRAPRDAAKNDSGACEVFAEQGSSASQMTAANIMDGIARLPSCDGQAADAISAYT